MFDIDRFLAGEQGVEVYNQRTFQEFRSWASRHGWTWRNGADPESETLVEDANCGLSTERGVRRYVAGRRNVYIMIEGHLSQRMPQYARSHNIERISFYDIPDDTLIDEEGFEVENL